jgi:DNA-binding NarL/FixJ family response regulator
MVEMITAFKLLSNSVYSVRDILSILTRQEREQVVVDLYNQGKTIRDIAKEVRMSFRDIGTVLKTEKEKEERQKKQLENVGSYSR